MARIGAVATTAAVPTTAAAAAKGQHSGPQKCRCASACDKGAAAKPVANTAEIANCLTIMAPSVICICATSGAAPIMQRHRLVIGNRAAFIPNPTRVSDALRCDGETCAVTTAPTMIGADGL